MFQVDRVGLFSNFHNISLVCLSLFDFDGNLCFQNISEDFTLYAILDLNPNSIINRLLASSYSLSQENCKIRPVSYGSPAP